MVGRIVLSILVGALALAATAVAATPSVRLAGLSPFRVQGAGFRPAEHVTVELLYAGKDRTAAATATARGGFVVSFGRLQIDRCRGYVVRAKGSEGSVAVLRAVRQMCPPEAPPG
jgi:hypothetical protein